MQTPNCCVIVIGNEILSGRTKDKNLVWLAEQFDILGIRLAEARVIPDVEAVIVETLKECRSKFTYIFTTGGIGPTHDDITAASIAKMAGVPLVVNANAKNRLIIHYGGEEHLNEARLRMATLPEGSELIDNPVSGAPGFKLGNIYVMAGVPSIMQAMFGSIKHTLVGGEPLISKSISAYVTEGLIAADLTEIANKFKNVEIGSYPFARDGRLGTSIVLRCTNEEPLAKACAEVKQMFSKHSDILEE